MNELRTESVELPSGPIEYLDNHGNGPTLLLVHGLLMNATLWSEVAAALSPSFRVVIPTLPMGGHSRPASPEADLTPTGLARLLLDLVTALELHDVTMIGNDTGGALVQLAMTVEDSPGRPSRVVLVSCDAFDNFPPGATGRTIVRAGKLPPALFTAFVQQLRLKPVRRMPIAFGWLTKRGDRATRAWLPSLLHDKAIRLDTIRVLRGIAADRDALTRVAEALPSFPGPVLVVWAADDKVMPPEHGRRLTQLLPHGRLVEIADSYTLIPLDQPQPLAAAIGEFMA